MKHKVTQCLATKMAVKQTRMCVIIILQVTRKELYEKYKSLWQTLSDSKKLRYIKMAIDAKKKYDVCLAVVFIKTLQSKARFVLLLG